MTAPAQAGLAGFIRRCNLSGAARHLLLLRLNRLPPALSKPHHLRLAQTAIAPMLGLPRAELFDLPGSLAVGWRGEGDDAVMAVIDGLEQLLADTEGDAPPLPELLAIFDLPDHADLLMAEIAAAAPPAPETEEAPPVLPLDPPILTLLETCLAQADLSRFARRRRVWRMSAARAAIAWEGRTLSVAELATDIAGGCDLAAEPWLYRRLTRTLDRRMLALLSSPGELQGAGPFAIGLNVASLLSGAFLRFDSSLPPPLRRNVIVAMEPVDLLTDARPVTFALEFARTRGMRTLLRAGQAGAAGVLGPAHDKFDLVELAWPDLLAQPSGPSLPGCEPERTILTGCDGEDALDWGLEAGITLFSGHAANTAALA